MIKRINKYSIILGLIVSLVILLIESIIQLRFSYCFSLTFIIGLFTGLLVLFISDLSLEKIEYGYVSKPKIFFGGFAIFKMLIYGVVLYFSTLYFGLYTAFTCAFGFLFNKLIIKLLFLVIDPKKDKKRLVDKLNLSKEIIEKLKYNDFFTVIEITEVNRERLRQFLNEKEIELVIKSLKEYELFIKGELEAIIDDDENVDV